MDKYDKLTEKFFNYLQNIYIGKNVLPENFPTKLDMYFYFQKTMEFFMRGIPCTQSFIRIRCARNLAAIARAIKKVDFL